MSAALQTAFHSIQKAIELAPNDGEINFNMGVIFEASESERITEPRPLGHAPISRMLQLAV